MMKLIFLCVFGVALIGLCQGFACPPNFCSSVNCENGPTAESCAQLGSEYEERGTLCGCCPACVKPLNVGDSCVHFLGAPAKGKCRYPAVCVIGKCLVLPH